ncbi:MAG: pyridoxine 5'-phosphate synthase [Thermoanaerobaculia bacterium]
MTTLCVNVDHVATIRQARGVAYPDPLEAARLAERAGAVGITVHLRQDRRHNQDRDVVELRRSVAGKLNLEMATADEMLALALEHRPDQVTLVPERPEEVTTEGGLDLYSQHTAVARAVERLAAAGIDISIFVDPDPRQLQRLTALRGGGVSGFEINTDRYTRGEPGQLENIQRVAAEGAAAGLRVYAGHGLTTGNVGPVAAVPAIEELNIGHALVSRAVLVGMTAAVEEMLAAMTAGESRA